LLPGRWQAVTAPATLLFALFSAAQFENQPVLKEITLCPISSCEAETTWHKGE
jgi:hypothetical protein